MAQGTTVKIDNRYEILGELGRGGMGVVYRANDPKMDRLVAIKVMTSQIPGKEEYQERFLREARSIAKMQHPNIVVVYDYGYHAGAPYMAMEYVEGVALDKVIASRVSLAPLVKVDFMVQVCQALNYAHENGIIHRDVKPGNIMVLEDGRRVKLLDFGIARATGSRSLSKSGMAMGTTCYMSPEQTKGQKNLDGRADIFSAGVVLYELLAGRTPWTSESDYEIMTKIINDPYPPISGFLRNCPPLLEQVFELALAKDPGARYQTAEQMAHALSELEAPLKEQALEEALVHFEQGDLLRANDLVIQILRIDSRYREAIELRNKLQQGAELQERSEHVQQLRMAAEQAVGQKRYSDALMAIEQAISIDSANPEIFHYRELIRHEVKRREDIRKKLELAKRAQEINDLPTAQELVDKALQADPTDTQARVMKSNLEQEKKKQQQQELAEDTSRALAARAFTRAQDLLQRLEALDPNFGPLSSLKKMLLEGRAEEKRRAEIEDAIREIRRVLEIGDVTPSLALSEQALARFPGEPRLARLRAQAESLRDAAERERSVQNQLAAIKKLAENGQTVEALAAAENALKQLGADHRLQSAAAQLRQMVEGERQRQAEQAVLARAMEAARAADYESALKILAAARIDFPSSKGIADALRTAQEAMARRADADIAERARKREIAEALEHALASEPNPEAQIRLAEEANRKIPGNEAVEQLLARVRQRQQHVASAVKQAQKFEEARKYSEARREWERVRELYPQYPQLAARLAHCSAALQPARKAAPPAAPKPIPKPAESIPVPAPPTGFSATSMTAAVKDSPPPIATPAAMPAPAVVPKPVSVAAAAPARALAKSPVTAEATPAASPAALKPKPRPNQLWLMIAAGAGLVIVAVILYFALRPNPSARPNVAKSEPVTSSPPSAPPGPTLGTLSVETNVDQADIYIDGNFKNVTEGRTKTLSIEPGSHQVEIRKQGYTSLAKPTDIVKGVEKKLRFDLTVAEGSNQPAPVETRVIIATLAGASVRIDREPAKVVPSDGTLPAKITPGKKHHIEVSHEGYLSQYDDVTPQPGETLQRKYELRAIPKPISIAFTVNGAASASIQQGQPVSLDWSIQNAMDVTIDPDLGIGRVPFQGSRSLTPDKSLTYTLTAKGEGTAVEHKTVTISVAPASKPTISVFEAGQEKIHLGERTKLTWATKNSTDVSIDHDIGRVDTDGSHWVNPTSTTTYTLTAKGPGGVETRNLQVTVEAAPAPVPTPSQAAPPPPAPTPTPLDELERKAVLRAIQVRYQTAYNSMLLNEVLKVWPTMPADDQNGYKETFSKDNKRKIRAVQIDLSDCDPPKINGNSAECTCWVKGTYTEGDASRDMGKPQRDLFGLKKKADGVWYIDSFGPAKNK